MRLERLVSDEKEIWKDDDGKKLRSLLYPYSAASQALPSFGTCNNHRYLLRSALKLSREQKTNISTMK